MGIPLLLPGFFSSGFADIRIYVFDSVCSSSFFLAFTFVNLRPFESSLAFILASVSC
jgi:hypothetical protein